MTHEAERAAMHCSELYSEPTPDHRTSGRTRALASSPRRSPMSEKGNARLNEATTLLLRVWYREQERRAGVVLRDVRSPGMATQTWTRRGLWGDVRRFLDGGSR